MTIVGRGPDLTVLEKVAPTVHLGFHRLAIVMVSAVVYHSVQLVQTTFLTSAEE